MDEEFEDRLPLPARLALILFGLACVAACLPAAYVALVVLGGGHGSPFAATSMLEWLTVASVLGIPLLILLLGMASIAAANGHGLGAVKLFTLLIALDILLALALIEAVSSPAPLLDPSWRGPS